MTTITRPASEKQIALIARLAPERDHDIPALTSLIESAAAGSITMRDASTAIDILFGLPRKPQAAPAHEDGAPLSEGYYLQEDTVYRIVKAKSTGNLYAKRLVTTDYGRAMYEYAAGAMRHLTSAPRLTVEEAAAMGVKHGICVICAATLTDPESVARGIGPVCAARL